MPDAQFSSSKIEALLGKSLLGEFSEQEAATRVELAACYRLFELAGWNDNVHNHLSVKVIEPDGSEAFLLNPFGLRYGEITASSLIKVDLSGQIKHGGCTGNIFGINKAGFVIHGAIHRARPFVKCVMHSHDPSATGIACINQGLREISMTSHKLGSVAYHDYQGISDNVSEQESLAESLGDCRVMFLRNHGVLTASESVSSTWYLMHQLLQAAQIQSFAATLAMGQIKNLYTPSDAGVLKTKNIVKLRHATASFGVKGTMCVHEAFRQDR